MFKAMPNGFWMTFENGWTASVQWGYGNYIDTRHEGTVYDRDRESVNAEVAAWDANDNWHNFGSDTVEGWKTPEEVAAFLLNVSQLPPAPIPPERQIEA